MACRKLLYTLIIMLLSISFTQEVIDMEGLSPLEKLIERNNFSTNPIASILIEDADIELYLGENKITDRQPRELITYNTQGYIDEQVSYVNGIESSKTIYQYNTNNQQTDIIQTVDGKFWFRETSIYNNQGKLIETIFNHSNESLNNRQTQEYDDQSNRIRRIGYNSENAITFRSEYDTKGNQIEYIKYSSERVIEHSISKYDDGGNKVEYSLLSPTGNIMVTNKVSFNANGDPIKDSLFDKDGLSLGYTEYAYEGTNLTVYAKYDANGELKKQENYSYDSLGNQIEKITNDFEWDLLIKEIYRYDSQGNMLEHATYDSEEKLLKVKKCEFEFDNNMNWIQRTCINNFEENGIIKPDFTGRGKEITFHTIKYY